MHRHPHFDLRLGAEVIIAARLAVIVVVGAFVMWLRTPHVAIVAALLVLAALVNVGAYWAHLRRGAPVTPLLATGTMLIEVLAVGAGVLVTGGVRSPATLIWCCTVVMASIWIGVGVGLMLSAVAAAFLVVAAVWDPSSSVHMSPLQTGLFAAAMIALIPVQGGVVAARQQSALQALARAELEAVTDPLTKLGNRAAFEQAVETEVARARRGGTSVALALLDLDDFKAINDTRGHAEGDAVLVALAARIRHELRRGDTPARFGGEEFVILFPDTTASDARHVVQRMLAGMRDDAGVTFSAGVTAFPDISDGPTTMLKDADTALYAAKHAGKNRVRPFAPRVAE